MGAFSYCVIVNSFKYLTLRRFSYNINRYMNENLYNIGHLNQPAVKFGAMFYIMFNVIRMLMSHSP